MRNRRPLHDREEPPATKGPIDPPTCPKGPFGTRVSSFAQRRFASSRSKIATYKDPASRRIAIAVRICLKSHLPDRGDNQVSRLFQSGLVSVRNVSISLLAMQCRRPPPLPLMIPTNSPDSANKPPPDMPGTET